MGPHGKFKKGIQENSGREVLIDQLAEIIDSNLNNDQFGVDALAQTVGMSRSSLHRKLHKLLGISTSQFIREYRLKKALKILKNENITASETAYRVGFSSPTYFNTCFNKFYGFTPGEVKSMDMEGVDRPISGRNHIFARKNRKRNIFFGALLIPVVSIALYYVFSAINENDASNPINLIVSEKSIVVLPFKNWTGNAELEYISDGMTDAVISRLTKIDAIERVIPFTSALHYKQTEMSIDEITRELGVANLLQGNLQISGNQIKINLQLIHGSSNVHLWSEEYLREWKSDEIFQIQAEVVEATARNMQATISENELTAIKKIPTQSKQAYSYYLQAEFQRNKANESAYKNAIQLYEKSIEIDSNFVESYTSLARVWSFGGLVWGIFEEQVAWQNAKQLLEKALEIEPNNKEVEEELYSGYFFYDWNFELLEPYYQRMLNNFYYDDTPSINADYAIKTGRYEQAVIAMDELIISNPSFGPAYCFKAEALMFLGRADDAIDLLQSTSSLYSDNWFYLRESAKLYYYLGEYKKSKIQLEKMLSQFSDYPPILMWLNTTYAQMEGDLKTKDKHLSELHHEYNNGASGSPAWFLAMYYCTVEDYERVFEWLQKSYARHEVELTWLREEPLLAPLRSDARYKDLYNKVGFSNIGLPVKTSSDMHLSK